MDTLGYIDWTCPYCATVRRDDIDDEIGPFLNCTCETCGQSFDQQAVGAEFTTALALLA